MSLLLPKPEKRSPRPRRPIARKSPFAVRRRLTRKNPLRRRTTARTVPAHDGVIFPSEGRVSPSSTTLAGESKVSARGNRAASIQRKTRLRQRSLSPRAVATRTADALWSKRVAERACGYCEWWYHRGRVHFGDDPHHVISRRYRATRHVLGNGVYLARQCHRLAHSQPVAFRAWFASAFPQQWAAITAMKEAS